MKELKKHKLSHNMSEQSNTRWWRYHVALCGKKESFGDGLSCMTAWDHEVTCRKCINIRAAKESK